MRGRQEGQRQRDVTVAVLLALETEDRGSRQRM